jgi:uncharacterized protein YjbI with pentapeptide repeats
VDLWVILILAGGLLILTTVPGAYLWWPSRADPIKRTDLGLALIAGAAIAFSIFSLQALFDTRLHSLEDRREDARREADRNSSAVAFIGLYSDLSGIDLSGRELPGLYLRSKRLVEARLTDANLTGAVLANSNLERADLRRADLSGLRGNAADFDSANLEEANLTGAILVVSSLRNTRLRRAILDGANLLGARADGADLSGATYNSETIFPPDIDASPCRAQVCVFPDQA